VSDDQDRPARITEMFGAAQVAARVDALAAEIIAAIPGEFVIVCLLKGAYMFAADLARALSRAGAEPRVEFMRLSSYGLGTVSAGEVHLLGDIPTDIGGRRVLLVDDIVDTGRSVAYAQTLLRQRAVAGLWTCALLDKPSRREVEVAVEFVGFHIEDVFVAGYGIDYAERFRHLPFIGVVELLD
jgi:hypoxanthine phosphoribosyltransferase